MSKPKIEEGNMAALKQDPRNARKHNERNLAAITTSISEAGFGRPLLASREGTIAAGNATAEALADLEMMDAIIVRSDGTRPIVHIREDVEEGSEAFIKLGLYDNLSSDLAAGSFHPDVLAELLQEVKLSPVLMTQAEADAIIEAANQEAEPEEDPSSYSRSVESPIYEPSGSQAPDLDRLVDQSKANELIARIDAADAPEEVKAFLRLGAYRHLRFDYAKIADFYPHQDPEVQELMERSALVIIDLEHAIEYGFVRLSEELRGIAAEAGLNHAG